MNGILSVAAHGLRLRARPSESWTKEIDSTAWAIDDVKSANPKLALAVAAIPPNLEVEGVRERCPCVRGDADVAEEPDLNEGRGSGEKGPRSSPWESRRTRESLQLSWRRLLTSPTGQSGDEAATLILQPPLHATVV